MMDLPRTPSFRLDGRRALVTGGSSGIGLGCAVALAEAGAHVTVMARKQSALDEVSEAFDKQDWPIVTISNDIADCEATKDCLSGYEPFDILVNSAGLARHAPATDTSTEDFDAVMNVNLRGAFFLAREAAKSMIEAKLAGSIITISSQMAFVGGVDRSVYCASKFAVEGFTKSMAIELAPHKIRINTISPTFIRTPLTEQTFSRPSRVKWIEEKIKLGRVGEIEDIMGAVQFLAGDAAGLVTGTSLLVDGGWTAD
jgi:NAD(P)-dependent dehydrogenase (short-subunit alcohol dehydrogenase family)